MDTITGCKVVACAIGSPNVGNICLTSRAADLTSVMSIVDKSNVERLITLSTSAVAVCCWRDFGQITRPLLHLLKQPRVLDGDYRLIGECLSSSIWRSANGRTSVQDLLIARTEGNPFFLEESVRILVETKVLTGEAPIAWLRRLTVADPRDHSGDLGGAHRPAVARGQGDLASSIGHRQGRTLAAYKLGACPMPVSYRMPAAERDQLMALGREPLAVLSDAQELKGITRAQMQALELYPATPLPDAVPQPHYEIVAMLPRDEAGKIRRGKLRDERGG